MKFNQITYLAVLAAVSMGVAAMPISDTTDNNEIVQRWCRRPDQGCYKTKRSDVLEVTESQWDPEPKSWEDLMPFPELDTETEDDEESQTMKRWCRRPGQGCYKKRSNDNEENTEPEVDAETQTKRWCRRPYQDCYKNLSDDNEEIMEPEIKPEVDFEPQTKTRCRRSGQACYNERSDDNDEHDEADLIDVDAINVGSDNDSDFDERDAKRWCRRPGQGCS